MPFDPGKHHRQSLRLKGYDYGQAGAYFVTLCAHKRESLFGQVRDGAILLSEDGCVVDESWRSLCRHFVGVELDAFVVMPNHLHGLIVITDRGEGEAFASAVSRTDVRQAANASPLRQRPGGTEAGSLGAIIQSFKSVSTRKINQRRETPGAPVWQRDYFDRVVRGDSSLMAAREYIANNPLRWELDEYNSARIRYGRCEKD